MQNSDKILYLECGTGISGDMAVAAMLDLGADQEKLLKVLEGIPGHGFKVQISRVKKSGLDCCDFDVILDEEHDGHDHDMEYLYGNLDGEGGHSAHTHSHDHDHHHDHGDDHDHHHDHDHDHEHHHDHPHSHHHHHTGMKEIREIIGNLEMTEGARALALRIFEILAQAESEAHGVPVDEVHFHEVGAIDSIVDIVAAAVCFDDLGIRNVAVTGIAEGSGTVRCQHGILQVPVPAVANIAKAHRLPMQFTSRKGELVTPTGAAIVAALMTRGDLPERFVIEKTGLGAGKREYEIPSILRAMVIESGSQANKAGHREDTVWKLECDIDDSTGEQLGYALEKLYQEGAREAHFAPVFMKKNRPGWELTVICDREHLQKLEDVIFSQTTTIGIRRQEMERTVLTRKTVDVKTRFGAIPVKVSGEGTYKRVHPEYEIVSGAASEHGVPFGAVYDEVLTMAYRNDDIS
ncbi:MAG: nickel pincer cofactor biosynthesis protein LarC [Lachnospiraceae bacterium]|nr:nickel pincer cofactor biosynthesis protein LarC [Lachnospiraceae bacterium]